jgi:hypothetical protein
MRAIDKIVEEILWNNEQNKATVPTQYKNLNYEELITQPNENLCIMNEQLKNLYKKKKSKMSIKTDQQLNLHTWKVKVLQVISLRFPSVQTYV